MVFIKQAEVSYGKMHLEDNLKRSLIQVLSDSVTIFLHPLHALFLFCPVASICRTGGRVAGGPGQ